MGVMRLSTWAALLLCACSSSETVNPAETEPPPLPGPEEWNREVAPPSDEAALEQRQACGFQRGALASETLGDSFPTGSDIPLDHVFVLMMENRSFDHYFQKLPEYGQPDVDVAPADFSNKDSDGNEHPIFHQQAYCFVDTRHGWTGTHEQIGGGAMSGFVTSNEGQHEMPAMGNLEMFHGRRAMGYYDETDLPFYYWLASEFAIGDRYFGSMPGPTFPNRMYLLGASSYGYTYNGLPGDFDIIVDYLEQRQVDWRVYADGTPAIGLYISKSHYFAEHVKRIDDFKADAASGDLPAFAFIDPNVGLATGEYDNNDEHPPALAQIGQRFVAEIVDALTRSPAWSRSALFITYDEHGGQYDHVPPPSACAPDDSELLLKNSDDPTTPFDKLGPRVPFIVVSPYAKKHHVSHEVYDHTSITRFIEARFVVPAMTARDANAMAPYDMFDFDDPPFMDPPAIEIPVIPQDDLAACAEVFAGG